MRQEKGPCAFVPEVYDSRTGARRVRKQVKTTGMDKNTLKQMYDEIQ